jgi:methylglyoxal synthase
MTGTAPGQRGIALVAHDTCKADLVEWARFNRGTLAEHRLYATGTTGGLLVDQVGLDVTRLRSGPLGGDQQIGSRIAEGQVDLLVFFWDPLTAQPHEPDVRALLRLAVLANIPVACNRATADHVISSPLLNRDRPVALSTVES